MAEKPYIQSQHGLAAYGILVDPVANKVYNTSTPAFETENDANIANYGAVTFTELGSLGAYSLTWSATLTTGQIYFVLPRYSPGGTVSPALSDPVLPGINGPILLAYNGSAWQIAPVYRATVAAADVSGNPSVNAAQVGGQTANATAAVNFDNIANVSEYTVLRNTAQAGASGSITLNAGASATNSFYNDQEVTILSGTGAGQTRLITAYNGTTKVATVTPSWTTAPDNTSKFIISTGAQADIGAVFGAVLTAANVPANVTQLNGSSTPVDATYTLEQALNLLLAACVSKLSGAGTPTNTFRDSQDTKNRIVATVDAAGNRSAVTLTAT